MTHSSNDIVLFPKDKVMQALYERVVTELGAPAELTPRTGSVYFSDLCEAIIGQQLSNKAADTIISRIKPLLPGHEFTPEGVVAADKEALRASGSSYAKIQYIKNVAAAWQNNEIEHGRFAELDDEAIIKELTRIKGIGRWTAEMFLMFTLGRPDVFSPGDQGLKNAMMKAYNFRKWPAPKQLQQITSKWSPRRTFACRVLWRSLELK